VNHVILWPRSAKQAPATKPTYPEPTTAIRIMSSKTASVTY
jgi:hypothetical protein